MGHNKYNRNSASIHAEVDAINHLPQKKKKLNSITTVSLLVINVDKNGNLNNSNPCVNCLRSIAEQPLIKGYKIDKIYFSNQNGEIECHRLTSLLMAESFHISIYYRHTGFDIEKWYKWRNKFMNIS